MGFTDLIFPLFVIIVVGLYYLLPEKFEWVLLLAASWFFYGFANLRVFLLLPAFTIVTFYASLWIERCSSPKGKKALFIATLVVVFSTLFLFKYLNLFVDGAFSIARLLGAKVDPFVVQIVLPIGISFYTFQTAAYVVDVYMGNIEAEKHFGYYALFVSYFPQLVAGPIERFDRLMPQLKRKNKFSWQNMQQGVAMMTAGFVKKMVVADTIARFVDSVYNNLDLATLSSPAVLLASMLFFVQIYCDFSGYSDIAVGVAKLMGVDLMKNFRSPFSAESVTDFWARWHISLSGWFASYVYQPLSLRAIHKKNKVLHYCLNTLIVMLISGFWHGAEWSFLLWGLVLASYQIGEMLCKKPFNAYCKKHGINRKTWWRRLLRKLRTYVLLCLSMVFFRAENVTTAFTLYQRIFIGWQSSSLVAFASQTSLTIPYLAIVALGIGLMVTTDKLITFDNGLSFIKKKSVSTYAMLLALCAIVVVWSWLVANGQLNSFIYFRF